MNKKVIVSSRETGPIWHAIIVRNVGFEVGEISDYDIYTGICTITCKDGAVFKCDENRRTCNNLIEWMAFDKVERWLEDSIFQREEELKNGRVMNEIQLHEYQNLLKNAERLREMMMREQQIENLQQEDFKIKMEV